MDTTKQALEKIDLGMKSFNDLDEVQNIVEAGVRIGQCINEIEAAREILENQGCEHPYFEVESYHDGAMICNKRNMVIEQHGERIDPPSEL